MSKVTAQHFSRRNFLGSSSAVLAASWAGTGSTNGGGTASEKEPAQARELRLDSAPVLQNPRPDGITVVWAVTRRATGWVEYGETQDLGSRADPVMFGQHLLEQHVLAVRLEKLKPATTYYYRAVAAAIDFNNNLTWKRGSTVGSEIFAFRTPTDSAEDATFSVINDTHANAQTVPRLFAELLKNPADYTIWNGDLGIDAQDAEATDEVVMEHIIRDVLRPAGSAYAATKPLLFVAGNHDVRSAAAHLLAKAFTPWNSGPLGRCFVFRHGPLAIVALDTGEDKPDAHGYLGGMGAFEPYRVAQREWLSRAVAREDFRSAPCKVGLMHIPLYGANSCAHSRSQWSAILSESGVQLIICGHDHSYRYDPPDAAHRFGQLVGGGPLPQQATLIRGHATRSGLAVQMCDLSGNEVWAQTFPAPNAVH